MSDLQQHGVIPRSAAAIFDALKRDPDYLSSTVYCSLLEIYNEELSDLLVERSNNSKRGNASSKATSSATKLYILEGENGPFCRGLSESKVTNAEDLLALMKKAHQQRMTGETDMNKESSRSHCIFTLRVVAKRKLVDGSILEVSGKLHCVDLAGSECAKSCGNAGKNQAARERERMNINRSLLTLGRVVKLLKEKSEKPSSANSVRIPYRDSKLTRILQESLGGRCKTCLIATISPSVTAIEESMSTLNYAQAANGIINKPVTTSLMSVGGFDNKSPRGEGVSGAGTSIEHWHEMECRLEYMQSQVDEAQQALARKHIQHQEIVDRAEKAEMAQELAERNLEKAKHENSVLESKIEDVTQKFEASERSLRETKVILGATQETEMALTDEAKALLQVLQSTIIDGDSMHQALVEKRGEDVDRKSATKEYQTVQLKLLKDLLNNLQSMGEIQKEHRADLEKANCDQKDMQLKLLDQHSAVVEGIKKDCLSDIESVAASIQDGILPVFGSLVLSKKESLESLSQTLEGGQKQLQTNCQTILTRLSANSKQMAESEAFYTAASKKVEEAFSTHLHATRQHLTTTVASITTALQKAKEDRQLLCKEMKESLGEFNGQSNDSINQLVALSNSHIESTKESIQSIKDGKENRSSILQAITNMGDIASNKKDEYIQKLERQVEALSKQHDALIASNEKQQQMNKQLVSNVMSGVQSLIAKEMNAMNDFQSKNHSALIESNVELKSSNEQMAEYTCGTFEHLERVKGELHSSCQETFDGQDHLGMALETKIAAFDSGMETAVGAVRKPMESYSKQCESALEKFETDNIATTDAIVNTTTRNVDVTTNKLLSYVEEVTQEGLSELQKSVSEGYQYVQKQVLDPVGVDILDNIQASQDKMFASAQSKISSSKTNIEEGEKNVTEEANKGLEFASGAAQQLENGCDETFANTISEHSNLIKESHWLENSLEGQAKSVANQVAESTGVVSSSVDCLGNFTRDVILVEEDTPEIAERIVPSYSSDLTATKDPEVLLREAGLNEEDEENNENLPETESLQEERVVSPSSAPVALGDCTASTNSVGGVDASPPLKRGADKTKSNLPNASRKRYKTRLP